MDSPLWLFAVSFYGRPGVADACLRCQDEAGADVNLVLFLLWQGGLGHRLSPDDVAGCEAAVAEWRRNVVQPLRAMRRRLKTGPQLSAATGFRDRIKAAELEAERIELETLFHAAPSPALPGIGGPEDCARHNLAAYEGVAGLRLPAEAVSMLLGALAAHRPGASA